MARQKKTEADLGTSALGFSRFDEDYADIERQLKEELEAKLQEARDKKLLQKQKFEELSVKYKEAYIKVILEYAPKILFKYGIEIISNLRDIVKDEKKVELLNKANSFDALFESDKKQLEDLLRLLDAREDICVEVKEAMNRENVQQ